MVAVDYCEEGCGCISQSCLRASQGPKARVYKKTKPSGYRCCSKGPPFYMELLRKLMEQGKHIFEAQLVYT